MRVRAHTPSVDTMQIPGMGCGPRPSPIRPSAFQPTVPWDIVSSLPPFLASPHPSPSTSRTRNSRTSAPRVRSQPAPISHDAQVCCYKYLGGDARVGRPLSYYRPLSPSSPP